MIRRILAASVLLFSSSAHAELIDRGGGLIYDDVLNVTWLADMNYAKTSGYDSDGLMNFTNANAWAASLVYGGFSDWRLPSTMVNDTTCGSVPHPIADTSKEYNCTGSEMGKLYYEDLGGERYGGVDTIGLFVNKPDTYWAWSGTLDPSNASYAWMFGFGYGHQSRANISNLYYAMAVRDGDVAAVLSCDGFSPPADRVISVKKPNRVLPLRMTLRDTDGMSAWDLAAPVVNVNFAAANGDPSSDLEELTFAGRGDEGNQFLFDGTHWAFNLKTTGFAPGVYTITAKPGSADYVINPPCEVTLTVQ